MAPLFQRSNIAVSVVETDGEIPVEWFKGVEACNSGEFSFDLSPATNKSSLSLEVPLSSFRTRNGPPSPSCASSSSSQAATEDNLSVDGRHDLYLSLPNSPSNFMDAQRCGRPEGRFPLFPDGRCEHKAQWSRVRSKRSYVFFTCKQCGLGWCTPKVAKDSMMAAEGSVLCIRP